MNSGYFGVFALFVFLVTPRCSAHTDNSNVKAIQDLYRSFNYPPQLKGWKLTGGDPCQETWTGVSCVGSSIIQIFVSEHIETLEEIDMEYKELALESGVENWGHVPALGCTSTFITDLADAVIKALPSATGMTPSTSESERGKFSQDPVKFAIKMLLGSFLAFIFARG